MNFLRYMFSSLSMLHLKPTFKTLNVLFSRWRDEMTNTSGALRMLRREIFHYNFGDRRTVPNIGVILTDGKSNRYNMNDLIDSMGQINVKCN